ncbi:helix-turn-helix transcriptional regulator [Lentzea sp.]|uniref:helix-turn-helix transcriptional regulator n=1 Tax=Lentzea sp. TaxID=56099 RepID=UPI002ED61406
MLCSETVFRSGLDWSSGFSALVITADRMFGARLTGSLVHVGASRVDVVSRPSEVRPAGPLEERDLIVVDLDLPDEVAQVALDGVQRLQGRFLVAVLGAESAHLADVAVRHGAWSLLFKPPGSRAEMAVSRAFAGVLTPVEIVVVRLLADGVADEEIARRTGRMTYEVKMLIARLRSRFAAHNRAHLVGEVLRAGLID